MKIDRTNVRPEVLAVEQANRQFADNQVFPWSPFHPALSQAVYADGQLWYVGDMERHDELTDDTEVTLIRIGALNADTRDFLYTTRGQCRPIAWTQDDEDCFGREMP